MMKIYLVWDILKFKYLHSGNPPKNCHTSTQGHEIERKSLDSKRRNTKRWPRQCVHRRTDVTKRELATAGDKGGRRDVGKTRIIIKNG